MKVNDSPEEVNVMFLLPGPVLNSPQLIIREEILTSLQRPPARHQTSTDWPPVGPPPIRHEVLRSPRVDGRLDVEQPPEVMRVFI